MSLRAQRQEQTEADAAVRVSQHHDPDACVCVLSHFNHVRLFVTPWTVAPQVPLSMGFCRQEYWSGLPCPSPGDLPDPGMEPEPVILRSPALASGFFTTKVTWDTPGNEDELPLCPGTRPLGERKFPRDEPHYQMLSFSNEKYRYCLNEESHWIRISTYGF